MAGFQDVAQDLNIAVIGGGYAGMAAAVALADCGIKVTVFESAMQLGGRARGVTYQEAGLDNGQHLMLGCYRQTLYMVEKVGGNIERDFLRLPLQLELHREFSLKAPHLPAPFHLLVALLTTQGLTIGERLNAARFMLMLRRIKFSLTDDITVTELLARHNQNEALVKKLWEPLCIAALNTPVHKASAQVMLNVLRDALNQSRDYSDMLLPRINFTALFPQRAADFVEQRGGKVRIACGVEALCPMEDGIELTTAQGTEQFSQVICAAPPVVAAKLLRPIPALSETVAQIDDLEHQPIYTVYLQYPAHVTLHRHSKGVRRWVPGNSAANLPQPMIGLHRHYSQWLFDRGRIAGQHGLLAAVISAEGIHQELSQEALAQKVITELREEFGIIEIPNWFKVIAEKRATFCCSPNLHRPSQLTLLPRLLLAGDYTKGDYPATLEGAVISGLKCADVVTADE
jgi:squalene-associated FAD-dependent desaturase